MKISRAKVRELREGRGWLQADLASRAGLSKPYVSQIESGARDDPSPVAVDAIASALGVDPSELAVSEHTCPHCGHVFED